MPSRAVTGLLYGPHPSQSLVMTEGKPASGVMAQPGVFATTHWSVVLAAGEADTPQSSAALEKLCRAYWYPLYAHSFTVHQLTERRLRRTSAGKGKRKSKKA